MGHLYLFREMSPQDLERGRFLPLKRPSSPEDNVDTASVAPRVIFRATVGNLAKDQGLEELVAPVPYPPAFPCSPQGFWAIPIDCRWRENTRAGLSHGLSYKP